MTENQISSIILDCAFEIHREVGPGLLESVYEILLVNALNQKGLHVQNQVTIPIKIHGEIISRGFKADLLVENKVLIEIKSVETLHPLHYKQTLTYLKLSGLKLGLLLNFNNILLKDGLHRIVNGL